MDVWTKNDQIIIENLVTEDTALLKAFEASGENNLEDMAVSSAQGKFLYLLAKIRGAKRILEIGTFLGYSTIWLARAVPKDGIVISLEYDKTCFDIACKNIEYAGLSNKARIIQGAAIDSINGLINDKTESFDMIFIDADKPNYPAYLKMSMQLSKPGTVIYGDNVVRNGELCNAASKDEKVIGVRQFIEDMGLSDKLESTALQTVGIKGYDGFTISIVK